MTTRDPEWLPEDVDEALAFEEFEAENCPGCGEPKIETFDPANEWAYRAVAVACHACAARKRAEAKLDILDGVYCYVEKK